MPGITVLPVRSRLVAPAGIWTEAPAAVMRPLLMMTVPRSIGGRPVPSMMRTPVSAVTAVPCAACAARCSDARLPVSTRTARPPATTCVEVRNVIRMPPTAERATRVGANFWFSVRRRLRAGDELRELGPRERAAAVDRRNRLHVETEPLHVVVERAVRRGERGRHWCILLLRCNEILRVVYLVWLDVL